MVPGLPFRERRGLVERESPSAPGGEGSGARTVTAEMRTGRGLRASGILVIAVIADVIPADDVGNRTRRGESAATRNDRNRDSLGGSGDYGRRLLRQPAVSEFAGRTRENRSWFESGGSKRVGEGI